jgi:hypothetical protein
MLRLWLEAGDSTHTWRASLETPSDGERRGFASLGDLFAFLERETSASSTDPGLADEV